MAQRQWGVSSCHGQQMAALCRVQKGGGLLLAQPFVAAGGQEKGLTWSDQTVYCCYLLTYLGEVWGLGLGSALILTQCTIF